MDQNDCELEKHVGNKKDRKNARSQHAVKEIKKYINPMN